MLVVAEHLRDTSSQIKDTTERDLFARSAFNRYYYATFLTIRTTLSEIDPKWDEPRHKEVPVLLRETVVKKFQRRAKGRLLSPSEAAKEMYKGCTAAKALAKMIEIGNETRKTADYEPKVLVLFENSTFSLNGVKSSTARKWCIDAKTRCRVLYDAARKLGLC